MPIGRHNYELMLLKDIKYQDLVDAFLASPSQYIKALGLPMIFTYIMQFLPDCVVIQSQLSNF